MRTFMYAIVVGTKFLKNVFDAVTFKNKTGVRQHLQYTRRLP